MSEEEKKAIEYFKRRIENVRTLYTSIYFKVKNLKILLNLIDKKDKVIDLFAKEQKGSFTTLHFKGMLNLLNEDTNQDLTEEQAIEVIKKYYYHRVERGF